MAILMSVSRVARMVAEAEHSVCHAGDCHDDKEGNQYRYRERYQVRRGRGE